jgi:hypothetical protein
MFDSFPTQSGDECRGKLEFTNRSLLDSSPVIRASYSFLILSIELVSICDDLVEQFQPIAVIAPGSSQ